jgi:SAM-dependent methyltransferase
MKNTPKAHPTKDEYNWENYTKEYSAQVLDMEKNSGINGSDFLVKNWEIIDGKLIFHDNVHENWEGIYSAVHRCAPKTVFECGCGGMYHLKNIKTMFPDIEVAGCDLLQSQIDFGAKKFDIPDEILQKVQVCDFSRAGATNNFDTYDFVFSHAVIMHISHNRAVKFFANMLSIAKKYVFLIEAEQHNYMDLLCSIGQEKKWIIERLDTNNSWLFTRK